MVSNRNFNLRQVDKSVWLQLANEYKDYNYRQSWDFGIACAQRVGAISEHVIIENADQQVIGIADVRVKRLPVIGGGIAYINGGPLVLRNNNYNEEKYKVAITALINEYILKRQIILRIAPPYLETELKSAVADILSNMGFMVVDQSKKTIVLDLTKNYTEIRKSFHQKWRNCLNKVEKCNLEIRAGKDTTLFQQFIPLFNELIIEKAFTVDLGIDFYASVHEKSSDSEKYFVTLALINEKPIAGHVASILGDTCVYLLGAANDLGRKLNAAYLLQWNTIKLAKDHGCRWYDLGGIDPEGNPGVYRFKQRMGGQEVDICGPYEMRPTGYRPLLTQFGEKAYKLVKPYLVRA